MSIRVKCEQCGSVLKIKDELAGTDGKCPKCKTKFVVPSLEESAESESAATEEVAQAAEEPSPPARKPAARKEKVTAPVAEPASAGGADDDFDPMAVLMDETAPNAKASAGLAAPPPEAPKPNVDRLGRRRLTPTVGDVRPDDSPAAASANAALNASANARDLLSKSMEESRVRAASMPEEAARPSFDYAGFGKMLLRGAPAILGVVIGAYLLYLGSAYMMGGGLELPRLSRVTGTVMVDDKPLSNVQVKLTPVNPIGESTRGKSLRLRTASGLTDENGYFDVEYMSGKMGAPLGKVRIWLEPVSAADFMKIPAQYSRPGNDIREVREAGNAGNFDLKLSSK